MLDALDVVASTRPVSGIHQKFNENADAAMQRLQGYMAAHMEVADAGPDFPFEEAGAALSRLLNHWQETQWDGSFAPYLARGPARVYVSPSPTLSNIQRMSRVRHGQLLTLSSGYRVIAHAFLQIVHFLEHLRDHLGANYDIWIEREIYFFPVRGTLLGLLRYGRVYGVLPEGKDFINGRAKNRFEFALVLPKMQDRFAAAIALTALLVEAGWLECWLRSQE
jgi:hypothetical protein